MASNQFRILRREQSTRSREHRGVLTRVIYESDALEVLCTEMEVGSSCANPEFGAFSAVHFVVDGNPGFQGATQSADLVPGDSIIFPVEAPYTITNSAPSHSVILSVLFRTGAADARA